MRVIDIEFIKCRTWARPVQDSMAVFSSTGELYVKNIIVMNDINMDKQFFLL
jgi:hypothetical protein